VYRQRNARPGGREVWISGNKIQFREADGFALEGMLQKQQPRK
jgi:hypothetical protein